jgi:short-subunit dehydrogenase
MMGEIATPFASTYAASKAALTRFSDSLRMELAPFNIKVATIKPGGVKSDIAHNAREKTEAYVLCSTPIKRKQEGEEKKRWHKIDFAQRTALRKKLHLVYLTLKD